VAVEAEAAQRVLQEPPRKQRLGLLA
jgi:hypothetical protein